MLICPRQKLAFIHIYKTGGSSLTRLLAPHTLPEWRSQRMPTFEGVGWQETWHYRGQQHSKFSQAPSPLTQLFDNDWRYLVVCRNPYNWFASVFYEFYALDLNWKAGFNFLFGKLSRNRTFEDYIDFFEDFRLGYPGFWGFSTQMSFVTGIPAERLRVVRFESYQADVRAALDSFGIASDTLAHDLRRGVEKAAFTAYLRAHPRFGPFVERVFEEDFPFFGYRVGD